jgi:hypothetical protein
MFSIKESVLMIYDLCDDTRNDLFALVVMC